MRALTLGILLALASSGCESKGTYCMSNSTSKGVLDGCSCVSNSVQPNDDTCGPASDTGSICCAGPTWPDGDICTCKAFYCMTDTEDNCRCSALPPGEGDTRVDKCTGTHCCLTSSDARSDYKCTCGDAECAAPAVEITDCSPAGIATASWCGLLTDYDMPDAVVVPSCR